MAQEVVSAALAPHAPQLDGDAFVSQTYKQLLHRAAGARGGLQACMVRLAAGVPKTKILAELQAAPKARSTARNLPDAQQPPTPATSPRAANPAAYGDSAAATRVNHVNELLALPDDQFLKAVYWNILGRPIDAQGEAVHAERLRQGWSRMFVVRAIHTSQEGQAVGRVLPGLRRALARYEKAQRRSLEGWYRRSVLGAESDLPSNRMLRAVYRSIC